MVRTYGRNPRRKAAAPPAVEASWRGILDMIQAGAYTCDPAGLITYFNPTAEAIWGRAPKLRDPAYRYCGSFKLRWSNGTPMRHDECWMALALREVKEYSGREVLIERPDGVCTLGLAHAHPLHDHQGKLVGAVNLVLGIEAGQRLQAKNGQNRPSAAVPSDAVLAMIEIGLGISTLAALALSTG